MLFLLSPAKALDYDTPPHISTHTQPLFKTQAAELIGLLKTKTPQEVATLMKLSDTLAGLNVARYQAWSPNFTTRNAKPALLAFNGDVYEGLNAKALNEAQLAWAQNHICILSGLYGVLRPLDLMQPYRLEMGTALATGQGKNLYHFWGQRVAHYLNERAQADTTPVVVNLASDEYFKVVVRTALKPRVVSCGFEDWHGGKFKTISFNAKRARGLMARYAVEHQATSVKKLEGFCAEGWGFDASASQPDRLVFRRNLSA